MRCLAVYGLVGASGVAYAVLGCCPGSTLCPVEMSAVESA